MTTPVHEKVTGNTVYQTPPQPSIAANDCEGMGSSENDGSGLDRTAVRERLPMEVENPKKRSVPHVVRDPSTIAGAHPDLSQPYPDSFALYDMSAALGPCSHRTGEGNWSHWVGEFAEVVTILEPEIRRMTQSDHFYYKLRKRRNGHPRPSGNQLQPRGWTSSATCPPVHEGSQNTVTSFGFKVYCDQEIRSGCMEWLAIHRELHLYPDSPVYSVAMSNGVHRLACNHCLRKVNDRCGPGKLPTLHPAVELHMRMKVRENYANGHGALSTGTYLPMLLEHARTKRFLHCSHRHPEVNDTRENTKNHKVCWHADTHDHLATLESGYFPKAASMPCTKVVSVKKREGRSTERCRRCVVTSLEPVYIHPMLMRRGDDEDGHAVLQTALESQIVKKLVDLNGTFGRLHEGRSGEVVRPADGSMTAFWNLFRETNLFTAWNKFLANVDGKDGAKFNIHQWRLVGLLCRKRTKDEMARDGKAGKRTVVAMDGSDLTIDDWGTPRKINNLQTEREYDMVYVVASLSSLLVSVKAWACRKVTGGVVMGMDHMYNVIKGVSNCYLFNLGVTDVKGMHHPTVGALQLGKGLARNKAVGSVWHHAHEWVRHHMGFIIEVLARASPPYDIRRELGLPLLQCCDDEEDKGMVCQEAMWEEEFPGVGMMCHAVPQVKFKAPSFKRDLEDRNYLTGVTDGDQSMWTGTLAGMGDGLALQNRSGVLQANDACSFHKGKSIKLIFLRILKDAKLLRSQDETKWDREHGMGYLFNTGKGDTRTAIDRVFQAECGDLLDGCMQHDCLPVVQCLWDHLRAKSALMGVSKAEFDRLSKNHHPVTGNKGHHGRATQTHELALYANAVRSVIETEVNGVRYGQEKGKVSSANNLEGRINKSLKKLLKSSMRMEDFFPVVVAAFSGLTAQYAQKLQFSILPDFFGLCASTTHGALSGRVGNEATGRNFSAMFKSAMAIAADHRRKVDAGEPTPVYHRVGNKLGKEAEYIVATEKTMDVAAQMVARHAAKADSGNVPLTVHKAVDLLRSSWVSYIKNPAKYATELAADALTWSADQAIDHVQDDKLFVRGSRHGVWKDQHPTAAQVTLVVEADILFNAHAFHRIVPRAHLTHEESAPFLQEEWRYYTRHDRWNTDIGFFTCLHCNQYSKTRYCVHVAAVTLIEAILPGVPGCMQKGGVGNTGNNEHSPVQKTKYGKSVVTESPVKMRNSSQEKNRNRR